MKSFLQQASYLLLLLGAAQSALSVDLMNDKNNCGRVNHVCHENDGVASCVQGTCQLACNDGWVLKNSLCTESKAHKKQRMRKPLSLCPKGETACPIAGSRSFDTFKHTAPHQISELLSAKGGYECLDVVSNLENCGGCAATGQGQDCTKLPYSSGVGCSGGQCVIFSCQAGYGLSLDGSQCQRKSKYANHASHTGLRYGRVKS